SRRSRAPADRRDPCIGPSSAPDRQPLHPHRRSRLPGVGSGVGALGARPHPDRPASDAGRVGQRAAAAGNPVGRSGKGASAPRKRRMTLAELQSACRDYLITGDSARLSAAIVADSLDAAERLNIYRNNFLASLTEALKSNFPVTLQLLGSG